MSAEWGAAPFMTECSEQPVIDYAITKKVGYAWYDYSGYCNVPDKTGGCMPGQPCAFGACIT